MDDEFEIRPGRLRDSGSPKWGKARKLVGQVVQASHRSGYTPLGSKKAGSGTGRRGLGKRAAIQRRRSAASRRVVIKARVVRHRGVTFRSAPLARHIAYLERDGVSRDGSDARVFDDTSDDARSGDFAERCKPDRHHFRFIVSPEDAEQLADLRTFTRELMEDMSLDLGTRLDWVAVDHWDTGHPHVHVLVRGTAESGDDLVIDRRYISSGMRARSEERVTAELGPRSEHEIRTALRREVVAERWTGLDRSLHRHGDAEGVVDLGSDSRNARGPDRNLLVGRCQTLERMGLAQRVGALRWTLAENVEPTLRALGDRGDIIRTMHKAMAGAGQEYAASHFQVHGRNNSDSVTGRLAARGLHDELSGEAYAIVEGVDGRSHYLQFSDIDQTGDGAPGVIVEAVGWTGKNGRRQESLQVRCDLPLAQQIAARGATWLDRQLVSSSPQALAGGFGQQVAEALERRTEHLVSEGLARLQGRRTVFARRLLETLRDRELADAVDSLASRYDCTVERPKHGATVHGVYRERVVLASGRFAAIDNGHKLQLVPWRKDIDRHLGATISGRMTQRGTVDWSLGRSRGPAL